MILLDTNVLSELMKLQPNEHVVANINSHSDHLIYISAITHAEILQGVSLLPEGKRKQNLQHKAQQVLNLFLDRTLPFTRETSPFYAEIICERTRTGRPIDIPDALIAAIAVQNQLTLLTRNVCDFELITGLSLQNPWH